MTAPIAEPIPDVIRWSPLRVNVQGLDAPPVELMDLAHQAAPDPDVFDKHAPFFLRAVISVSHMDAFGTVMRISSLQNYARDASSGVAVLNSHDIDQLPIGRSVLGTFIHNRRAHPAHTVAEAYLLSDWSNGVVNTNDLIAGIRGGVLRDVSIGFHGGRIVCSICNQDMFGFRTVCEHFPGVTYDVNGEDEPVQAIGLVEDARLSEFSIVYKGACPGAMIDKAYRLLESGALTKKDAKALDSRFRMRLALSDVHPVAITTSGAVTIEGVMVDDEPLANEQPADPPPATLDAGEEAPVLPAPRAVERDKIALGEEMDEVAIRELLTRAGAPEGVDLEWVVTELQRLRPLADVGAAYRVDLIEDALAEGVRAKGAKFPTEQWRGMLQKLDLAEIKLHRAGWQSDADDLFTKGRQTTEEAAAPLAPNEKASIAVLPDLAYRA